MRDRPTIPLPLLFVFEGILILLEVPSWFGVFEPRGFEIDQSFLDMVKVTYIFKDIGTALFVPMIIGAILTVICCVSYLHGRSGTLINILLIIHMIVSVLLGIFFPMDRYLETPVVETVVADGYTRGSGPNAKSAITVNSANPNFPIFIHIDILPDKVEGRSFYVIKLGDSVYKAYDPAVYNYHAG